MRTSDVLVRILALCMLAVMTVTGVCAQTPMATKRNAQVGGVVDVIGDGKIDWTKREVRAIGIGFPMKNSTGARALVQAREAAIAVAERNLLKVIEGVHITSETTVLNLTMTDDTIKTQVNGLLKGATIVSEKSLPDQAYQVVLSINLYGKDNSLADEITLSTQIEKAITEKVELTPVEPPAPAADNGAPPVEPTVVAEAPVTTDTYTGLVVDCRGFALARSMCPRILDQMGNNLWGTQTVSTELINEKGMADYCTSPDDPGVKARAGQHPLVVKALRASGGKVFKTDAVLSPADFERVRAANEVALFLEKLNVVFLVD